MKHQIQLAFDVQPEPITHLKSGSLTCLYQHGKLRYIRNNGEEILRSVYIAVRDHNWNTAPYDVTDLNIIQKEDGFDIRYIASFKMNEVLYKADVEIVASGNSITYRMKGQALSNFKRNRIGICVLYPVQLLTAHEITVQQPDGNQYSKTIPRTINPHEPAKNIRSLKWKFESGSAEAFFEGDTFEMEDQRNWSDSSFKVYSTPQERPKPVDVHRGDRVEQEVRIVVDDSRAVRGKVSHQQEKTVRKPLPAIGFSKVPGKKLTSGEIAALKKIPVNHYRVELDLASGNWKQELADAIHDVREIGTHVNAVCKFGARVEDETKELITELFNTDHLVHHLLVIDSKSGLTSPATITKVYPLLKEALPYLKVGYGTNGHFADLNRNLPSGISYDYVSFGLTPQAHSTDVLSMIENLDNQQDIIETLQKHLGKVDIHVSPITFKGRKAELFAELPGHADRDERQHSAFGAAWVLKALANFSGTTVTLFDATGYKGILSETFEHSGYTSPLYNVLAAIKQFGAIAFLMQEGSGSDDIVFQNEAGEFLKINIGDEFHLLHKG